MKKAFYAEFIRPGILRVTFAQQDSSVNLFNHDTATELDALIEDLKDNAEIKLLYVTSGKKNRFCAGADVKEIQKLANQESAFEASRNGQKLFNRWSALPFPTVAIINGACAGGGTEWALSFDYRIALDTNEARIGLPEIKLGVIPGWGGCVRLPRLIGLRAAMEMVLKGDLIPARKALENGVIDQLIDPELANAVLPDMLLTMLENGTIGKGVKRNRDKLWKRTLPARRILSKVALRKISQGEGAHYPAPMEAVKTLMFSLEHQDNEAFLYEARKFAVLATSRVCKNLLHLFLSRDQLRKDRVADNAVGQFVAEHSKIGLAGAGQIGEGITALALSRRIAVRLCDPDNMAIAHTFRFARRYLRKNMLIREPEQLSDFLDLLHPASTLGGMSRCSLFIEASPENPGLKEDILQRADRLTPEKCILVSTTSAIPLAELAATLEHPEYFAGLHFFTPVDKQPIVEIVRTPKSADQTIVALFQLVKSWGKVPLIVKDGAGYFVNRLRIQYFTEAMLLLQSGVAAKDIDRAMKSFGMRKGPFRELDDMGLEPVMRIYDALRRQFLDRCPENDILLTLLNAGREGKASGKGFYTYKSGGRHTMERRLFKDLNIGKRRRITQREIQERLMFIMVNEAAYCLEEKVIYQPEFVDVASVFAMGFPPYRGGLLQYADRRGLAKIAGKMRFLAESAEPRQRYVPAPLLVRMVEQSQTFYAVPPSADESQKSVIHVETEVN